MQAPQLPSDRERFELVSRLMAKRNQRKIPLRRNKNFPNFHKLLLVFPIRPRGPGTMLSKIGIVSQAGHRGFSANPDFDFSDLPF